MIIIDSWGWAIPAILTIAVWLYIGIKPWSSEIVLDYSAHDLVCLLSGMIGIIITMFFWLIYFIIF